MRADVDTAGAGGAGMKRWRVTIYDEGFVKKIEAHTTAKSELSFGRAPDDKSFCYICDAPSFAAAVSAALKQYQISS
jgi:hypothetical protein